MKSKILNLLKTEVKPAMGCTEPVAVTLAAAKAASIVDTSEIIKAEIRLCPNVYKNGLAVGLPGTGKYGHEYAVAFGISGLNWEKGLSLYEDISEEIINKGESYIKAGIIHTDIIDTAEKVLIEVSLYSADSISKVTIKGAHDNIVLIEKDNDIVFEKESGNTTSVHDHSIIFESKISDLIKTIENIDDENLAFMYDGIEMNKKIAHEGIDKALGMGIGSSFKMNIEKGVLCSDLITRSMMYTAGASDARMSGIVMPVMSSNGSGNNGLTAILPIYAYSTLFETDRKKLNKAIAISHTINSYIKNYIGKLSPICGCGVAAATGSAAAIVWLMGGSYSEIDGCIKNMIGNTAGMICDGAKNGCAMKLSTSAAAAVQAAITALNGKIISGNEGIVAQSAEETVKNLGLLAIEGMKNADITMIEIMKSKMVRA